MSNIVESNSSEFLYGQHAAVGLCLPIPRYVLNIHVFFPPTYRIVERQVELSVVCSQMSLDLCEKNKTIHRDERGADVAAGLTEKCLSL